MIAGFPNARPGMCIGLLGGSFDPPHAGHVHITREALKRLPQRSIAARFDNWPSAVTAKGPSLAKVLEVVRAPDGAKLKVVALDGYAAEFEAKDVAFHDWIVAIEADGEPLGIGGRGPTWLMFDTGGKTLKSEDEALWVWSAFMIVVE